MDPVSLAALVVGLLAIALCGGGGFLLLVVLVVGVAVMRREGEAVSVPRAVQRGATRMSMIFVRQRGVVASVEPAPDEPNPGTDADDAEAP